MCTRLVTKVKAPPQRLAELIICAPVHRIYDDSYGRKLLLQARVWIRLIEFLFSLRRHLPRVDCLAEASENGRQ